MKDKVVKSRFSISEIRDDIVLQKSIEHIREVEEKAKVAREEKIALENKLLQEKESEIFIEEFGRKLLESAAKGNRSLKIFHLTHDEELLIKRRGFNVSDEGKQKIETLDPEQLNRYKKSLKTTEQKIYSISKKDTLDLRNKINNIFTSDFVYLSLLSTLLPQLKSDFRNYSLLELIKLGFHVAGLPRYAKEPTPSEIKSLKLILSLYDNDHEEPYISQQSINWSEYDEHDNFIQDCVNSRFLFWLSDIYGKELISQIFSLIESCDLEGVKETKVRVVIYKGQRKNSHDEEKDLIKIFNIDIPFSLRTISSMLNILNYGTQFIRVSEGDKENVGDLIIRWE